MLNTSAMLPLRRAENETSDINTPQSSHPEVFDNRTYPATFSARVLWVKLFFMHSQAPGYLSS
jgi:hypothetical protein